MRSMTNMSPKALTQPAKANHLGKQKKTGSPHGEQTQELFTFYVLYLSTLIIPQIHPALREPLKQKEKKRRSGKFGFMEKTESAHKKTSGSTVGSS